MGKIVAICVSKQKGLQKEEVPFVNVIKAHGIEGDAHAGKWHRQISFLDKEDIEEFKKVILELSPIKEIITQPLGPIIGASSGPGTIIVNYKGK